MRTLEDIKHAIKMTEAAAQTPCEEKESKAIKEHLKVLRVAESYIKTNPSPEIIKKQMSDLYKKIAVAKGEYLWGTKNYSKAKLKAYIKERYGVDVFAQLAFLEYLAPELKTKEVVI